MTRTNGAAWRATTGSPRALPPGAPPAPQAERGVHRPAVEEAVRQLLEALGVPLNEHTRDTPRRVAQAWVHALRGQTLDPRRHLQVTFPGDREWSSPLVVVAGIRIVSTCAHHLLPIVGFATVGYRPERSARIVGLSKLARLVQDYAARATVQELIGSETVHAIVDELDAAGAACVITAEHGCMSLRGVDQPTARTTTVALAGLWERGDPEVGQVLAEHRSAQP